MKPRNDELSFSAEIEAQFRGGFVGPLLKRRRLTQLLNIRPLVKLQRFEKNFLVVAFQSL